MFVRVFPWKRRRDGCWSVFLNSRTRSETDTHTHSGVLCEEVVAADSLYSLLCDLVADIGSPAVCNVVVKVCEACGENTAGLGEHACRTGHMTDHISAFLLIMVCVFLMLA